MRAASLAFGLAVLASAGVAQAQFSYDPPGDLTSGSGSGRVDYTVYAPGIRFPIEAAPAFANSQVWGNGGGSGPGGGQCDAVNFSYPWADNYCEERSWDMPLCPSGTGHQGQDIRAATCDKNVHWVVAVADGTITNIGSYSVYLTTADGTRYDYLHMGSLQVSVGDTVTRGERIGKVSNEFGGTATTVHLHFNIRQNVSGVGVVYVPPYMSLVTAYETLLGIGGSSGGTGGSSGASGSGGAGVGGASGSGTGGAGVGGSAGTSPGTGGNGVGGVGGAGFGGTGGVGFGGTGTGGFGAGGSAGASGTGAFGGAGGSSATCGPAACSGCVTCFEACICETGDQARCAEACGSCARPSCQGCGDCQSLCLCDVGDPKLCTDMCGSSGTGAQSGTPLQAGDESGCACRVAERKTSLWSAFLMLAPAFAFELRRRRRRDSSTTHTRSGIR